MADTLRDTNCPMCGRLVARFFDHIAIDCEEMDDEEVAAALAELESPND